MQRRRQRCDLVASHYAAPPGSARLIRAQRRRRPAAAVQHPAGPGTGARRASEDKVAARKPIAAKPPSNARVRTPPNTAHTNSHAHAPGGVVVRAVVRLGVVPAIVRPCSSWCLDHGDCAASKA